MMSLRQYKLYVAGAKSTTCASNVADQDPVASVDPKLLSGRVSRVKSGKNESAKGEDGNMKVTIEITKRYTFTAEVSNQDEGEKIKDQLINGSRALNYPITLPDNVFFRGADLDGAITFVDIRR